MFHAVLVFGLISLACHRLRLSGKVTYAQITGILSRRCISHGHTIPTWTHHSHRISLLATSALWGGEARWTRAHGSISDPIFSETRGQYTIWIRSVQRAMPSRTNLMWLKRVVGTSQWRPIHGYSQTQLNQCNEDRCYDGFYAYALIIATWFDVIEVGVLWCFAELPSVSQAGRSKASADTCAAGVTTTHLRPQHHIS